MNRQIKRVLSFGLTAAMLLTCTLAGLVLPTAAITPEYGDVELLPQVVRPNLLTQQGEAATAKIWEKIADISDPATGSITLEAGVGGKYWNLSFLELNTTYRLTGRVKGGAPNFFFCLQIKQVNSTSGGNMSPQVNEEEWTEFSYTFTTGDTRPPRECDWIWFGNTKGTTTAYFEQLSIVKYDLTDLTISNFTWNDTESKRTAAPGDVLQDFSVTLTNNGTMPIGPDAEVSVDICADATRIIATLTHKGGLGIGESVTLTSTVLDKWTATAGDHAITAYAYGSRYVYEKTQDTEDNQIFYNLHVADTALTAPDVAAENGFTELTFSDHFDTVNTIDNNATGKTGFKWYVTRPYGESTQVLDTDYSVENGILRLHTDKTKWAYSIATIDIKKMVGFAFNKGYLEYRIRVPAAGDEGWDTGWAEDKDNGSVRNPGVWAYPTKTLWASAKGVENADSVEMDWMEYYGNKYSYTFSTTLHERHSENVTNEETGKTTWTETWHTTSGEQAYDKIGSETEFHTLSCLWEDGRVTTYLDGKRLHTVGYAKDDYPSDRVSSAYADQPTVGSMAGMDTQFLPIILGGSEQFQMEVDFVRVWQAPEDDAGEEVEFTMEQDHVDLFLRENIYLKAVDANGNEVHGLNWTSSDTSIVSVYGGGYVRANAFGTATVLATDKFGNTATCAVTVDRYKNLIQNGDFEGEPREANWYHLLIGNASKSSSETYPQAELVTEGGNTYMKILANSTAQTRYYKGVMLRADCTYQVTFRYKGSFRFRIYDQNDYIVSGNGNFALSSASWQNASYTFTVGSQDTIPTNGNLTALTIGFLNIADQVGYLDDFSICEVKPANTITVQQATGGTVSVSKTTGLTAGETVTVTVSPNSGYMLKAGSLIYTTQEGDVRKILNNNQSTGDVYGGAGNVFTMVVPVGATTVTAEFVSTATNNYQFGTIATAVRRVDGKVDAVRFLNRLYIDGLDLTADSLTVRHNGQLRTVTQIGVLMTRGHKDALTLDDYNAYKSGQASAKVWHALSYKNTSSTLFVLEYTDRYMDFIINMSTTTPHNPSFLLRDYTICGYMMLDNGEIIYTDAMWDNAADAMAREAELK